MPSTINEQTDEEIRRTAPLALWRYSAEYLRAALQLCGPIHVRCAESQVPNHIAAQGIEFALKAFLRARGATMDTLTDQIGHSLPAALTQCEALGMQPLPGPFRKAIDAIAPFHQNGQFVYPTTHADAFPEIDSLVDAGVWLLDQVAPDVVDHYAAHLASDQSPSAPELLGRLRADLSATSASVQRLSTRM
jgi:hypothetical protein